jgi:hypothetical protein
LQRPGAAKIRSRSVRRNTLRVPRSHVCVRMALTTLRIRFGNVTIRWCALHTKGPVKPMRDACNSKKRLAKPTGLVSQPMVSPLTITAPVGSRTFLLAAGVVSMRTMAAGWVTHLREIPTQIGCSCSRILARRWDGRTSPVTALSDPDQSGFSGSRPPPLERSLIWDPSGACRPRRVQRWRRLIELYQ